MKFKAILLVTAISVLGSGCSFWGNKTENFSIHVTPEDAEIFINGEKHRQPVMMTVPTSSKFTVVATKKGYASQTQKCDSELSTLGKLDLVGLVLFLVPGVGLFSDGAYQLSNPHIYFQLEKQ